MKAKDPVRRLSAPLRNNVKPERRLLLWKRLTNSEVVKKNSSMIVAAYRNLNVLVERGERS
jgi:hypothetical protein